MLPIEQNYEIYNKELLAIVVVLRYQRVYYKGALGLTIYSDYKNLQFFTTTKDLLRRQYRQLELLGQYKFDIIYTLGKDNRRANALSRRSDYIEGNKTKLQRILKVNKDSSLSAEAQEFNTILRVLRDDSEQFLVEYRKYQVPLDKELDYIRDYYDRPINGYPSVVRTVEHIRRNFAFPTIRQKVSNYIRKCLEYNKNKALQYVQYSNLEFRDPLQ